MRDPKVESAKESGKLETTGQETRPGRESTMPDEARRRILKKLAGIAVAVPAATVLLDGTTMVEAAD